MVERAKSLLENEKQWLLSKRTLIGDHDDDVMVSRLGPESTKTLSTSDHGVQDAMKESSCAWLLFQACLFYLVASSKSELNHAAVVDRYDKLSEERTQAGLPPPTYDEVRIPYWEACML